MLFAIVMELICREFWVVYVGNRCVYDLAVIVDSEEEVIRKLNVLKGLFGNERIEGEFINDQANDWRRNA